MSLAAAPDFAAALAAVTRREVAGATGIANLRALSGGAVQETWAFEAQTPEGTVPLILRRARPIRRERQSGVSIGEEAQLVRLAATAGVPVPPVRAVLRPEDAAGDGFIMDFVPGETIARKILRDAEFAEVRPRLARQCGEILARLHAIDTGPLGFLDAVTPESFVADNFRLYDQSGHQSPVFELAFRWLDEHLPPPPGRARLVHGDFRNGNLIVGADGVRAVLDWELAHLGDPMMDLGYICVTSWRFGEIDKPVGGFGERAELYAGYEAAGGTLDRARAAFWELACTLRWGMNCLAMGRQFITGSDRSAERGAIGRRMSETEIDLLRLIAPRD